jgi:hypothetical protein
MGVQNVGYKSQLHIRDNLERHLKMVKLSRNML